MIHYLKQILLYELEEKNLLHINNFSVEFDFDNIKDDYDADEVWDKDCDKYIEYETYSLIIPYTPKDDHLNFITKGDTYIYVNIMGDECDGYGNWEESIGLIDIGETISKSKTEFMTIQKINAEFFDKDELKRSLIKQFN